MKHILIALAFSLLYTTAWASSTLSKEECRIVVEDLQRMSNMNPCDVEAKAPDALSQLRNGETLTSYFIAFNIYAENLFNKGKTEKARLEIERMLGEALAQTNEECKVIALRTQGIFYYKLGLYERAANCFRKAMRLCPRYDSELLEHYFTWSSTLFWLVKSDIRVGRMEEAEHWLRQMDDMMKWLDGIGDIDNIGYKPVMIRGLKANIEMHRCNPDAASELLQQCQQYILPEVPARAYVEYYEAQMQLCVQQGKHQEALHVLDRLIDMHINDYKPIAAEYIYQKGVSLAAVGDFEESAKALVKYVELKEQVNEVALACMLDEMTTQYEVKELQHERDNVRKHLFVVLTLCVALTVIIALVIVTQRRIHQKNKTLARNISELNRMVRETAISGNHTPDTESKSKTAELVETGNRIIDYINQTQCFLNVECSRDTIKEGLGVTERTLAKAIMAATGCSFVNYINQLRLNVSIEMLEEKPEMTINDIATACGFGTVRQFQRIFKQHYDLSPSAYRVARSEAGNNS